MLFNNLICHNLAAFIKIKSHRKSKRTVCGGDMRASNNDDDDDDDESENWNRIWNWSIVCGIENLDYHQHADKRLPKWAACWNVISPILTPIQNWRCYQKSRPNSWTDSNFNSNSRLETLHFYEMWWAHCASPESVIWSARVQPIIKLSKGRDIYVVWVCVCVCV